MNDYRFLASGMFKVMIWIYLTNLRQEFIPAKYI